MPKANPNEFLRKTDVQEHMQTEITKLRKLIDARRALPDNQVGWIMRLETGAWEAQLTMLESVKSKLFRLDVHTLQDRDTSGATGPFPMLHTKDGAIITPVK